MLYDLNYISVTDICLFPVCSIYNEVVACLIRLGSMINSGRSVAVQTCQQIFLVHDPNALESKQKVSTGLFIDLLLPEEEEFRNYLWCVLYAGPNFVAAVACRCIRCFTTLTNMVTSFSFKKSRSSIISLARRYKFMS